jgi:uncharacterized secreted repeat protein (TIGR03808 family)
MAIFSEFSFEGALIADNIIDEAASGISVSNFNEGGRLAVVSGNIVRNLTGSAPYFHDSPGFGIGISVEADAAVTGNVVDGAPRAGIWVGWGPYLRNVSVTGNVVRMAPVGITVSVVDGVASTLISDNLIQGAHDGAVVGMRWAERATADLTLTGASTFDGLTVDGNHVAP